MSTSSTTWCRPTRRRLRPTAFATLQQLFKWLEEEGEAAVSAMARMHPPKVPVPVLSDELRRLLAICAGKAYVQRRKTAVISLFLHTGMRLPELANLTMSELDR